MARSSQSKIPNKQVATVQKMIARSRTVGAAASGYGDPDVQAALQEVNKGFRFRKRTKPATAAPKKKKPVSPKTSSSAARAIPPDFFLNGNLKATATKLDRKHLFRVESILVLTCGVDDDNKLNHSKAPNRVQISEFLLPYGLAVQDVRAGHDSKDLSVGIWLDDRWTTAECDHYIQQRLPLFFNYISHISPNSSTSTHISEKASTPSDQDTDAEEDARSSSAENLTGNDNDSSSKRGSDDNSIESSDGSDDNSAVDEDDEEVNTSRMVSAPRSCLAWFACARSHRSVTCDFRSPDGSLLRSLKGAQLAGWKSSVIVIVPANQTIVDEDNYKHWHAANAKRIGKQKVLAAPRSDGKITATYNSEVNPSSKSSSSKCSKTKRTFPPVPLELPDDDVDEDIAIGIHGGTPLAAKRSRETSNPTPVIHDLTVSSSPSPSLSRSPSPSLTVDSTSRKRTLKLLSHTSKRRRLRAVSEDSEFSASGVSNDHVPAPSRVPSGSGSNTTVPPVGISKSTANATADTPTTPPRRRAPQLLSSPNNVGHLVNPWTLDYNMD